MAITPTSVLSCLTSSALFTVLAWVILKNDSTLRFVGKYICMFLFFIVVRTLLPVEFGFTMTFISKHIMTGLRDLMITRMSFRKHELFFGQVILFLWIVGALGKFFSHTREYIKFSRIIRRCPDYLEYDVESVTGRINSEYGKTKKFKVLLVPCIKTPVIFGLVFPKILMPRTDYTEEELFFILKHEMLHYYQHDMLVKFLCEILCTIYWWNPAVFFAKKLDRKSDRN